MKIAGLVKQSFIDYPDKMACVIFTQGCNFRCGYCHNPSLVLPHLFGQNKLIEEQEVLQYLEDRKDWLEGVVITGGEPALQLTESLVEMLHLLGKTVAVETNGTIELPKNVDWITLSPKDVFLGEKAKPVLTEADELKVVITDDMCRDAQPCVSTYPDIKIKHHFLQPCDQGGRTNVAEVTAYIHAHPCWRLSLQTHKLLGIR